MSDNNLILCEEVNCGGGFCTKVTKKEILGEEKDLHTILINLKNLTIGCYRRKKYLVHMM